MNLNECEENPTYWMEIFKILNIIPNLDYSRVEVAGDIVAKRKANMAILFQTKG